MKKSSVLQFFSSKPKLCFIYTALFVSSLLMSFEIKAQPTTMPSSFIANDIKGDLPSPAAIDCNGQDAQTCPYDNQPTKYITMNLHFVCRENGKGNFNETGDGDTPPGSNNAYKRAEELMKEINRQLSRNAPERPGVSTGASVCKLNIQFVLGGVIIHRIPYNPDTNVFLGIKTNGQDSFDIDITNSNNFVNTTLANTPNTDKEYNYFFYPMINGKTGQEDGLNGYTFPGASHGVSYGNWVGYKNHEKTNPDLWYFQAHARTIIHEFFHTLGLLHPFNNPPGGPDFCDDTFEENPPCWDVSAGCPDDNVSNNIMDYNPFNDWSMSPCQICLVHQSLEGTGSGFDKSNYVTYQGNCTRPSSLIYIPSEICNNPNGFGVTVVAEGTASMHETSYSIEAREVLSVGGATVAGTTKTKSFTGQIGKVNIGHALSYNFKVGKTYALKFKVQNACFIDEITKFIKIKDCNPISLANDGNISSLNIYPNPVADQMSIEYDVVNPTNTRIDIIDLESAQIIHIIKDLSFEEEGAKFISVNMPPDILNGHYVLRFISSEDVMMHHFFLNR